MKDISREVFTYVSPADKRAARLVCRQWRNWVDDPTVWVGVPNDFLRVSAAEDIAVVRWQVRYLAIPPGTMAKAFREACTHGRLGVAQCLAQARSNARLGNHCDFRAACEGGHFAMAQWLMAVFALTRTQVVVDGDNYAFIKACGGGHMHVAEWLADVFELKRADLISLSGVNRYTRLLPKGDQRALAKEAVLQIPALAESCEHGHLGIAKWLVGRFGLSDEDIRSQGDAAFYKACAGGHLEVAQWVKANSSLTRGDVAAHKYSALHVACIRDNADVVRWLVLEFGLVGDATDHEFHHACWRGRLEMAQWLAGLRDIPRNRVVSAFRSACGAGRLNVAQWLAEAYAITNEETVSENNSAYRWALVRKHIEVVKWLIETYDIRRRAAPNPL